MVSLVGHAGDAHVPSPTASLLTGSIAVTLAAIVVACTALPVDEFPSKMRVWIAPTLAVAGVVPILVAALDPAPLVLVVSVSIALLVAWLVLFAVFLASGGNPEVTDFQLGRDGPRQPRDTMPRSE